MAFVHLLKTLRERRLKKENNESILSPADLTKEANEKVKLNADDSDAESIASASSVSDINVVSDDEDETDNSST
jgi:hypothetical protein